MRLRSVVPVYKSGSSYDAHWQGQQFSVQHRVVWYDVGSVVHIVCCRLLVGIATNWLHHLLLTSHSDTETASDVLARHKRAASVRGQCAAECADFEKFVSHSLPRLSLSDGEEVQHGVVGDVRRVRVTVLVHGPLTVHSETEP